MLYASGPGRGLSREMVALGAAAVVGMGGVVAVLAATWGGPTSRFDGFVYVESNTAKPRRNSILAYRFAHNSFAAIGEYRTGGTGTITLSLSYNGGAFNFAGGGVKGSTPFSFEYDSGNGLDSSYTIVTDSSTTHRGTSNLRRWPVATRASAMTAIVFCASFAPCE